MSNFQILKEDFPGSIISKVEYECFIVDQKYSEDSILPKFNIKFQLWATESALSISSETEEEKNTANLICKITFALFSGWRTYRCQYRANKIKRTNIIPFFNSFIWYTNGTTFAMNIFKVFHQYFRYIMFNQKIAEKFIIIPMWFKLCTSFQKIKKTSSANHKQKNWSEKNPNKKCFFSHFAVSSKIITPYKIYYFA